MWTVVYIAQNENAAQSLQNALEQQGLLVRLRPVSREEDGCYEVLVPEAEVSEAHGVMIDSGF